MNRGSFKGKNRVKSDSPENSKTLAHRLADLSKMRDTPALIAHLAGDRARLLLCKALVSPVSASDRQLVERAHRILRSQGMHPEELKNRLEPAALALGLVSACDAQIDYYQVLGVRPSATASELRGAYRKKAFALHPDTARQSTENGADFLTVKTAYDTLTNPERRAAFDQCRIALDAWHEENTGARSDEREKKQSPGKVRKAFFRVAAVVAVMVVVAWVISIVYENETMVAVVEVTPSSTVSGPAREAGRADDAAVEKKLDVAPERVEEKVSSKPAIEKPVPEPLQTAALLATPRKIEDGSAIVSPAPANTAVLSAPETVDAPETAPAPLKIPDVEEKKPDAKTPAPKSVQEKGPKEAPAVEWAKEQPLPVPDPAQMAISVVPAAPEKRTEDVPKAKKLPKAKKEKPIEPLEIARKDPPKPVAPKNSKLPEPSQPPPAIASARLDENPPIRVFPDIPIPKTHKTPFVKRSQVVEFLKDYTAAYEKGNAQVFFSFFTADAVENGKPVKNIKPDYLEIWEKVQGLDYQISVNETEQVVDSQLVSMKGRFDLAWKFLDGSNGQSRGEISMDLKVNKDTLRISRLDYRFDE